MNIKSVLKNNHSEIYLNIGSGEYVLENFINIDNSFNYKLSYYLPILRFFLSTRKISEIHKFKEARKKANVFIFNCRKSLPLSNESVDHIICSHFLEHVYFSNAKFLLKDYHRILKKNGTLHIILPDLEIRTKLYLKEIENPEAGKKFMNSLLLTRESSPKFFVRLLEFVGNHGALHRWMYDKYSISKLLTNIGFKIEPLNNSPSSFFRKEDTEEINILVRKI